MRRVDPRTGTHWVAVAEGVRSGIAARVRGGQKTLGYFRWYRQALELLATLKKLSDDM